MGGCCSVSMSCDQVVNQCSQWLCVKVSYIHNLSENLASLEKAMGSLKAKRDDLQRRVDKEEFTGRRQRLVQVQDCWSGNNARKGMEERVNIVGLYGMGGVGKTTLLKQINNKFSEIGGRFDVVIWVVVSKNVAVHRIQGDIAKKLGLGGKEWDEKNDNERALDIHNVLKRKKFVLILDDIWEKVNLNEIGVPNPGRKNGCKVAFTTRNRDVCGRMGVDDPIQVRCLATNEAWDLFEKKVGKNTLGSHQDIPKLARKVAEKCRGLPLALNVIGETMASKNTIREWRRAIDVLTSSASDFSGVENEIYPILKYSYDSLNGEQVKSCFLYCSLFPEDHLIDKAENIG
ncbi:hypothetical protein AALP_AA1G131900 [Arabis alpina]|uniref:NB-ARC domain-containing protein n=1 Tax=Arabis alpina TaxID=50452 RepID=A0A087HMY8_ARAAL|nr:hypothetical protein AALP_AA1G131900 [Arabis alpina]